LRERKENHARSKQEALESRIKKLRNDAEWKLEMLEEFKKTLDEAEFKDQLKEEVRA